MKNDFRMIRKLADELEEAEAERDLYEMMAHDLASAPLITAIEERYPKIAAKWREYEP